ncbi:MAG TPA: nickel-dependent lactate racemase [bacterium]|jgi:nickel-dependent lactate racemase
MTTITLPYDKSTLSADIDDSVDILKIDTNPIVPLEDPHKEFLLALKKPVQSQSFEKLAIQTKGDVIVLCSDHTRVDKKETVLPWILDELNFYGIPDERISILVALGTHVNPGLERILTEIGPAGKRVKVIPHDQDGEFIDYGISTAGTHVLINKLIDSADLLVMYSAVIHHYFAGYGGGRKIIMPGIASLETIRQNHSLLWESVEDEGGRSPFAVSGILNRNPIHKDIAENVEKILADRRHFSINTVLSPDKEFCCFYGGNIFDAHHESRKVADELYQVELPAKADVVIAASGGFPKDLNLVQAHKGMDNAVRALKPGGTLIYAMGCVNGSGNPAVEEFAPLSLGECKKKLVEKFIINGASVHSMKLKCRDYRIIAISMLDRTIQEQIGMEPVEDLTGALEMTGDLAGKSVYYIPRSDLIVSRVE